MSGEFKEVKLPAAVQAKLKELLSDALTGEVEVMGSPNAQDLGSPDVPAEFAKAAEHVNTLAKGNMDTDFAKSAKGIEIFMRLAERATTPGSIRGEAVAVAQEYDRTELQEFVNVAAVMSQVIIQTLRHLEYSLGDDFPSFVVTDGMVTPLLAADVNEDGDCNCANCKARREGKEPPVSIADILGDAKVTVLAMEKDKEDDFLGDEGPIRDIAKALGNGKRRRKPPVS